MKTTALFSPEPAKGWMPWGALAPVLCLVIVALPAIAAWKIEKIFGLVSAKGDPLGFAGLCSLLFLGLVAAIFLGGGYAVGEAFAAWSSPVALAKIVVLFLGFAVQSSVEEILFRGWLMSAIARKLNVAWAVVLVSLVFMLLHYGPGQHWSLMLGTFLFSLFACGWALVKLSPVGSDALTGGAEGPEGSFLCTLFLAAASAWLFWRYLRNHAPRREET